MGNRFQKADFLIEYNNLISKAWIEHQGKFGVLASPTLNKQETVTFLYQAIIEHDKNGSSFGKFMRDRLLFIPRLTYHFFHLVRLASRFRVRSIPRNSLFIRTWLVPRSIKDGAVRDDYFRKLIDDLKLDHTVILGFQPLDYGPLLEQFKNARREDNHILNIGLLNIKDIIKLFIDYVFSAKIILKDKYLSNGRDVAQAINSSLNTDFYRLRSFQAYLERAIAEKLTLFSPKIFLYIFENQAWENPYLKIFKDSETTTIGYQTSGFSLRFLNFFPSELDAENSLFPDKILTVGESFTQVLKAQGNYPIPIETFAALRFEYPVVDNKYIVEYPSKVLHKRILYAFAVHVYQYLKIIKLLKEIFENTEIEIHLKFHPLYDPEKLGETLPVNFKIWDKKQKMPLKDVYDVVLFNDNSFGIEALMEGVKSYEFEFGELYPETRLMDFDCYDSIMDKDKAIKLRDEILTGFYQKTMDHEALTDYVNRQYIPYRKGLQSFFTSI